MRLLVDSHVLVWLLYEPERFSPPVKEKLKSADVIYVSAASLWELAEMHAAGRLAYAPAELTGGVQALGLKLLPVSPDHAVAAGSVVESIKNMFDRILVAQARAEGCTLVTADSKLNKPGILTLNVA